MSADRDHAPRTTTHRDGDALAPGIVPDQWDRLPIPAWTFRPAGRPRAEAQADGDPRARPAERGGEEEDPHRN